MHHELNLTDYVYPHVSNFLRVANRVLKHVPEANYEPCDFVLEDHHNSSL